MANILLDATRWNDDNAASPPAVWTGTLYDFTGDDGPTNRIFATANAGDTISFTLTNNAASNCPVIPNGFQVLVNGSQVYGYDLTQVGSDTWTSAALSSGDALEILANTQFVTDYAVDFTLTPTAEAPSLLAPDLSISVPQNSSVSVGPQLVLDGTNVDTTGLSIVTNPENGSAVANTPALTYAPNLGYNGSDSFQYQGMSLDGTVDSVTITNGGVGYTSAPSVTFGEPISGTQAQGTAIVAGGKITGVTITNPGTGYKTPPSVSFGTGIGTGATATAVLGQITSNVANVAVTVTQIPCQEMGRVTRAYVSAYQRNRVHESNCFSQENRCLIANFNGAIPIGRTITSVTWSCLNPFLVNMLQADVTGRETACVVRFQYGGVSLIRCSATFDNGEVYVQMFRLNVSQPIWFQGDTNFSTGPYTLVAVPDSTPN